MHTCSTPTCPNRGVPIDISPSVVGICGPCGATLQPVKPTMPAKGQPKRGRR
jgi:hypothetical protein